MPNIRFFFFKTIPEKGTAAGRPSDPKQNAFDEVTQDRLLIETTQHGKANIEETTTSEK